MKSFLLSLIFVLVLFPNLAIAESEPNDNCYQADTITIDSYDVGTVYKTTRRLYDYDLWQFTPTQNTQVHVYTTDATIDLDAYIYNNSCSSILLSDESGNNNIDLTFNVTSGVTYKIYIVPYTFASSNYTLHVEYVAQTPTIQISNFSDAEGNSGTKNFTIPVTLSQASSNEIKVDYTTSNGSASAGTDYTSVSGNLEFHPGETTKYIVVPVSGDTDNEGDETFYITLSNPTTGVPISGSPATVTIENDDVPPVHEGYRDFTLRKQIYLKGNMKTIGNSVLVPPTTQTSGICNTYTNGPYYTNVNSSNNYWYLCEYQKDSGTSNSTTAELNLPSNAKVIWAGLYWQALVSNSNFSTTMNVKLKKDNDTYKSFSYDILDYLADAGKSGYTSYSAFKDVTYLFNDNNWTDGNYTVADIPVHEGKVDNLGTYGAWNLVVVYEDLATPDEKFRSFSIFDGWKVVKNVTGYKEVNVDVSGFYTPNRYDINAEVSVFAAEGDKHIHKDLLKTYDYRNGNTPVNLMPPGETDQTFNSSISGTYNRTPNLTNNNGIDIQTHSIGNYLNPKQTDMSFQFTSTQDTYWPSVLAFNTELAAPDLCYDYSFKQNGIELPTSSSGIPVIDTYITDSPIETTIYIRNREADLNIEGMSFHTDMNSSIREFVRYDLNSTYKTAINGSTFFGYYTETTSTPCDYNSTATSPEVCTQNGNVRVGMGKNSGGGFSQISAGEFGDKEFQFIKFNLDSNTTGDVNLTINMGLDYFIVPRTGAKPIVYNYQLGKDIGLCPPSVVYEPVWGTFNIIHRGSSYNNLTTQVSKRPFDVDIALYEKDSSTGEFTAMPSRDINTTVIVEMFDVDPFHDINASCANPGASLSQPIYVEVSATPTDNTDPIPTQAPEYYNFAVKNAAFRIWYFNDSNGSLIENWTATTSDSSRRNLVSIDGLFNPSIHPNCVSDCSDPTSTTCFSCIKAKYASPLCSRDNFAIRPESFNVQIFDINQTANATIKDSTKIDITDKLDYEPTSSSPVGQMKLATGYPYRFDINATNHQDFEAPTGYSRYFNLANASEYNATLIWNAPPTLTGCNDTDSKVKEGFNIINGVVQNEEKIFSKQVGEYLFHIVDSTWTAVDYDPAELTHHTTANGFLPGADCDTTSSTTNPASGGKVGCIIQTNHTNTATSPNHIYKDINISFKPYTFDLTGLNISNRQDGTWNQNFIYMANVDDNNSRDMSFRAIGTIIPRGYDNSIPSNYVGNCYADDINISLNRIMDNNETAYQVRFIDLNSTGSIITDITNDINESNITLTVLDTNFTKDNFGTLKTQIYMNFDRNITSPRNPIKIDFKSLDVNCSNISDCQIQADLKSDYNISAKLDFNTTQFDDIIHYYGRVHAPDYRIEGNSGIRNVIYEVYCQDCNQTDYNVSNFESPDSIFWYRNISHNGSVDGNVSQYNSTSGTVTITNAGAINQGFEANTFTSTKVPATPNKDRVMMTPAPWLLYNRFDETATTNDFNVEFYDDGRWAGEGDEKKTIADEVNASIIQNRRLDW